MSGVGFDPSLLFSYYQAQLAAAPSNIAAGNAQNGSVNAAGVRTNSATANDQPPWENPTPAQNARDAQILSTTNFLNTSNVPVLTPSSADAKTEQDNQKLFSLYTAVNNVSYLASMAQRGTTTSGNLRGSTPASRPDCRKSNPIFRRQNSTISRSRPQPPPHR